VPLKAAVSLRTVPSFARRGQGEIGCCMAIADVPVVIDEVKLAQLDRGLLAIAREHEHDLFGQLLTSCACKPEWNVAQLREGCYAQRAARVFTQGVGMTNVGEWALDRQYRSFQVDDVEMGVNRLAGSYAVVLQLDGFRGKLRFRFAYAEPLLSGKVVTRLSEAFSWVLESFSKGTAAASRAR
jgi:hypothetical protein